MTDAERLAQIQKSWDSSSEEGAPTLEGVFKFLFRLLREARAEIAERTANQAGLQRAWGEEREKVARLEAEVEALGKLVYVPGLWRCAKCDLTLVQANLNGRDGSVTARDNHGDKCPNCDSPLWRVTERQAGNDMIDRCEAAVIKCAREREARQKLEAEIARLTAPGGVINALEVIADGDGDAQVIARQTLAAHESGRLTAPPGASARIRITQAWETAFRISCEGTGPAGYSLDDLRKMESYRAIEQAEAAARAQAFEEAADALERRARGMINASRGELGSMFADQSSTDLLVSARELRALAAKPQGQE